MSTSLSSEFQYTFVTRLGRSVIAEGNYNGVKITHEYFRNTCCYFIRAPFFQGSNKEMRALEEGGAWLKQNKNLVIVSWHDIEKANELTLNALYKKFHAHKIENTLEIKDLGNFKLKK